MDFDEPTIRGRLRKTGQGDPSQREQNPIYEYRLNCAEEFEGLPYLPELDDVMAEYAHSQKIHYVQEVPVVLEAGDLPAELKDAFYFPDTPTIEGMVMDVQKDSNGQQFLQGSFYVGRMKFAVEPGFPNVIIATESSDGSNLAYTTSQKTLFELLGAMYARNAARMLEQLHKQSLKQSQDDEEEEPKILPIPFPQISSSDIHTVVRELLKDDSWETATELFGNLANETGKSSFTTTAIFTPAESPIDEIGNERAMLATKVETLHGSIEQSQITLDINWFLGNANTEIIGTASHNANKKISSPVPSGIIQPIDYDIESFAFMKELELATAKQRMELKDTLAEAPHEDSPERYYTAHDPEWLMLVSIFMTTIRPHLKRHSKQYEF